MNIIPDKYFITVLAYSFPLYLFEISLILVLECKYWKKVRLANSEEIKEFESRVLEEDDE